MATMQAYRRRGALVLGVAATALMGIVGCTTVTAGNAVVDLNDVPAFRVTMSASISASAATSSIQESKRQQTLTTKAIRGACETFAKSSADAIETTNKFVEASNRNGDTTGTQGPAVDSLNHSADVVAGSINDTLSAQVRDALNAWVDGSHRVARAIETHAGPSEFNSAVNQLNDNRANGLKLCRTFY